MSTASSDLSGNGDKKVSPKQQREEPEVIKQWKERQIASLAKKDSDEEEAKLQLRQQAKSELDSWYKQHSEQVSVRPANVRPANWIIALKTLLFSACQITTSKQVGL